MGGVGDSLEKLGGVLGMQGVVGVLKRRVVPSAGSCSSSASGEEPFCESGEKAHLHFLTGQQEAAVRSGKDKRERIDHQCTWNRQRER
ncbi:hypothetical protein CDAR_420331 [Caerostris darwini]|uniref:Uncharacterized protein n=1 Tax=Caerostris darwini TaxID=1538125 RepID=A0AAV4TT13_9ARAC|nr:hypothetical protein CDAR_420331 [Caerostris darwini]